MRLRPKLILWARQNLPERIVVFHISWPLLGLRASSGTWVPRAYYNRDQLTKVWRKAVIALLRAALEVGQLQTTMTAAQMKVMLTQQEKRWWSVKIQCFQSKEHFLRYAGRYVRRPPIAQRRIIHIGDRTVTFWVVLLGSPK